jgi:hypothetical protein
VEIDRISDDCVVEVEEDHEVLLGLFNQVLKLLLEGADEAVVSFELRIFLPT